MKSVDAGQFAANVSQYLRDSLLETIVVTQSGKPCAVLHGVEYDDEQLRLVNSREFWSMIDERRNEPAMPWEEAKRRLDALRDE